MARKKFGYGSFYCWNCGNPLEKKLNRCPHCQVLYQGENRYGTLSSLGSGGIGWSTQINDPRFKAYAISNKKYGLIFLAIISLIIPLVIILGEGGSFDGETFIVIPIVLLIIWAVGLIYLHLKYGRTQAEWDGVVEDKHTRQRTRNDKSSGSSESYTEYTVIFRRQDGKKISHHQTDAYEYDYYNIGDYVHYHGGKYCKGLEKYDKSRDTALACFACGFSNDVRNTYCERCGCPLLKGQPSQQ